MRYLVPLFVLLAACGAPAPEPAPPVELGADAVAGWRGGELSFAEVESELPQARTPACMTAHRAAGGGSVNQLLDCYGEVAQALALERLVLAELDDVDAALTGLEGYAELRRNLYINGLTARLREQIEIGDDEVAARLGSETQALRRPGSLSLWHIFRRHEDPDRPEETMALLRSIKERALAGEPFGELAREYSQSENRQRDGLVGRLVEGQLPRRLEKIAFSLEEGGVSDPVPVRGGAVLLHVRQAVAGTEIDRDQAGREIRRQLEAERLREALEARAGRRPPPEGSLISSEAEVLSSLERDDAAPLLEVAGDELSVSQLRALAGLEPNDRAADLTDEAKERILALYRHELQSRLLVADLLASDDPEDVELRSEADASLRTELRSRLVDAHMREAMWEQVDADPEALERYYEDNVPHYQSQLRFELQIWDLPFADDPPRQLEQMEQLHEQLVAGDLDLARAVDQLGGEIQALGWRDFDEIVNQLPIKARSYLLQTQPGGYGIPYHEGNALHLLHVIGREEPQPLPYEEVRERVREDFFSRFEQRLYADAVAARLDGAGYRFDPSAVRRELETMLAIDPLQSAATQAEPAATEAR